MYIPPFSIEQFFAQYEFTTPHILCASDCETMTVAELLALAGMPLADLGQLRLGYTDSQGSLAMRTAVSHTYRTVTPNDLIILTTPEEGIYIAMRALLEPGDHAIVLTPAYDSLLNMGSREFVILESGPETYLQSAFQNGNYVIEKREGGSLHHFAAVIDISTVASGTGPDTTFKFDEAREIFLAYATGSSMPRWLKWQHMPIRT